MIDVFRVVNAINVVRLFRVNVGVYANIVTCINSLDVPASKLGFGKGATDEQWNYQRMKETHLVGLC